MEIKVGSADSGFFAYAGTDDLEEVSSGIYPKKEDAISRVKEMCSAVWGTEEDYEILDLSRTEEEEKEEEE